MFFYILQPVISETISEDITSVKVITRVKAMDADEYDSLHFELSGPGADQFRLDPSTGKIHFQLLYFQQHAVWCGKYYILSHLSVHMVNRLLRENRKTVLKFLSVKKL